MATIDWRIKGEEFANCNCSYGCPCQFNALPTHGFCCAAAGFQIEQGRFGDVKLDGLRAAGLYRWPGPVHEGNGTMQLIVDKSADARQREALLKIMNGEETDEFATMWFVFSAMASLTPTRPSWSPFAFTRPIRVPGPFWEAYCRISTETTWSVPMSVAATG